MIRIATAIIIVLCAAVVISAPASATLARVDSVNVYGLITGGDGAMQPGPVFSVNQIYALEIRVVWRVVSDGNHTMKLKYTTPDQTVYETQSVPFVKRPRAKANSIEVWGELLTAGTWVQRMPGNWKVDVLLDNDSTVLGTAVFTMTDQNS